MFKPLVYEEYTPTCNTTLEFMSAQGTHVACTDQMPHVQYHYLKNFHGSTMTTEEEGKSEPQQHGKHCYFNWQQMSNNSVCMQYRHK